LHGGKGGTRTLDPGIMRAVNRKMGFNFNHLPRGARPLQLAPRSTTEHDRVPQKSLAADWFSRYVSVGGKARSSLVARFIERR
jgi:hypothetical protein